MQGSHAGACSSPADASSLGPAHVPACFWVGQGQSATAHAGEHGVGVGEALQADGELHVARAHDVLHFEVAEVRVKSQLLDDLGVLRASPRETLLVRVHGHAHAECAPVHTQGNVVLVGCHAFVQSVTRCQACLAGGAAHLAGCGARKVLVLGPGAHLWGRPPLSSACLHLGPWWATCSRLCMLQEVQALSVRGAISTIFPEAKIRAVVFGSRMRMMTAANLCTPAASVGTQPLAPWLSHNSDTIQVTGLTPPVLEVAARRCMQMQAQNLLFAAYLWVVLCIPGLQSDALQLQLAVQVHSGHDVLQRRHYARGVDSAVDDRTLPCCAGTSFGHGCACHQAAARLTSPSPWHGVHVFFVPRACFPQLPFRC